MAGIWRAEIIERKFGAVYDDLIATMRLEHRFYILDTNTRRTTLVAASQTRKLLHCTLTNVSSCSLLITVPLFVKNLIRNSCVSWLGSAQRSSKTNSR